MALGMSFATSLVLTLINLGLVPGFPLMWLRAFLIGFAVSFPTSLAVIPLVKRIVEKLAG
ncbi:MAG: DUF2798 domain-containing protein [Candidatus Bathycorpusculaceae bacterium]